jgi:hypothetical protein
MRAGSPADYLGAGREWLPVREHDPVFAAPASVVCVELSDGKPVIVRAIAAKRPSAVPLGPSPTSHGIGPRAQLPVTPVGRPRTAKIPVESDGPGARHIGSICPATCCRRSQPCHDGLHHRHVLESAAG